MKIIKNTILIALLGLLGFFSTWSINYFNSPESVFIGDYSNHFEGTEKKVLFYGTNWCKYCQNAREFFKRNKIDYYEYNPEVDDVVMEKYKSLGVKGYPAVIIGNKLILGFNEDEIRRALSEI
ncbi:glutaredoxin family protein [Parashewanella spongiae]|nr:glutaredoxin family protein [Parashewanella spongiae]MCL1077112.1 glutaredoxin family protein [Parashewanella spongiae]